MLLQGLQGLVLGWLPWTLGREENGGNGEGSIAFLAIGLPGVQASLDGLDHHGRSYPAQVSALLPMNCSTTSFSAGEPAW